MKQHSPGFLKVVQDALSRVQEITPQELHAKLERKDPICVIDVREDSEITSGVIPTAIHLSKGIIERDVEKRIPDLDTPIVTYCSGGFRCALVADNLQKMGYRHVHSLRGGLSAWLEAGYSLVK